MATFSAPYRVDLIGSEGETFGFSLYFEMTDGSAFPFDDYTISYVLSDADGCPVFSLSEGDGITVVDEDEGSVSFLSDYAVEAGDYTHRCRITDEADQVVDFFDGEVVVTEDD